MKHFFFSLLMILALPLAVCAQNFEFQYQGKPLENGAVSIEAAEDLFGDLSCETNPAEAPETGLMLVSKDGKKWDTASEGRWLPYWTEVDFDSRECRYVKLVSPDARMRSVEEVILVKG